MMGVPISKSSVMTLFSEADGLYSHLVRLVLAEKEVSAEFEFVDANNPPQILFEYNSYGTLPTFVDRDLMLYDAHIIIEYLDERFPHPPLLPVYPIVRANARLIMKRIKRDWYSLYEIVKSSKDAKQVEKAKNELRDGLAAITPVFKEYPYFMSHDFSLIDCYMAPLLWRLESLGIKFPAAVEKQLSAYMTRLFERPAFIASLTEEEKRKRGS